MKKRLSLISILFFSYPVYAVDFDSILNSSDLTDIAACDRAVRVLVSDKMTTEPLYRMNQGQCEEAAPSASGDYFSDNQCQSENTVTFRKQSRLDFCQELSQEKNSFGDGSKTEEGIWWQHPGVSLDIGVESLADNSIPFETRVVYKSVASERGTGTCKLEMRVYKKNIGEAGLKPLLMFHGGSWNARQGGMIGLQSQLSHFTDDGFVVFTPFYRLAREIEANEECNGITGEAIVEDANDALDWVRDNAATYGGIVGNKGVLVGGQSAGGHLAASLAVHRPDQVSRALLLYPPTDFPSVIGDWQTNGIPENTLGLAAINGFIGESVETVDISNALIQANNFPKLAAATQGQIPPLYMIHGDADALVPVSQSARLCNGITGDPDNGPASDLTIPAGAARKVIHCDDAGSQLHVIAGADHILDVCIKLGGVIELLCPAGPLASQTAAKESIIAAREWLSQGANDVVTSSDSGERDEPDPSSNPPQTGNNNNSGGGAVSLFGLFLLFLRRVRMAS